MKTLRFSLINASFLLFFLVFKPTTSSNNNFTFNGFTGSNLSLDGDASITSNGLLQLSNLSTFAQAHAFRPTPLRFRSVSGTALSFSTTFVFAIQPQVPIISVHGLAFVISRTTNFSTALDRQYFGLFNVENNGNSSDHVFAVELDTVQNVELLDIDGNHVGIDLNSLNSTWAQSAGYYDDATGAFNNLTLISGQEMQVWIDYDGSKMQLNVTMSPVSMPKPRRPLMSHTVNLSSLMLDYMYVGFASASGLSVRTSHYVLGWSFNMNGFPAEPLDYAKLPSLPSIKTAGKSSNILAITLPIASCLLVLLVATAIVILVKRRAKYAELVEDWELEYGPHRFKYKDLFIATKGFSEKELLGKGGFGKVYRGVLPTSQTEVAVKRVSHESKQGLREFVSEIVSIGKLRHKNLVQLLGYCRRKRELLLVYEFMPGGSLDKFLYDRSEPTLGWAQRFQIIRGVASGLFYLHENWDKVVVHRDIKASNVLLDGEFKGRLGDFGLARLYDHGAAPHTTHIVGTMGYLAPELARTGKATTATDVFAFGAFLLEVVCGRRPMEVQVPADEVVLVGWVLACWQRGTLLETRDSRFGEDYCEEEVNLVLRLGLLCSNPKAVARPSMRQVVQILEGEVPLPELPPGYLYCSPLTLFQDAALGDYIDYFSSSMPSLSCISEGR